MPRSPRSTAARLAHLVAGLGALFAGLALLYIGYGKGVSLAGKTQTGWRQLRTGIDGQTRVPEHHWYYAGGAALVIGGAWWLARTR